MVEPLAWIVDGRFDPDRDPGRLAALHRAGLRWVRLRERDPALRRIRLAAWRARWPGSLSVHGDAGLARGGVALHDPESAPAARHPARPYGRSVHSAAASRLAVEAGADYVTFGNVWPTGSHPGRRGTGTEGLAAIVERCARPVRAVGGVTADRLAEVHRAGAAGFDVASAISDAADPAASVSALLAAWRALQ